MAVRARPIGCVDLCNDPHRRDFFTSAGLAVAHRGWLCLRVLGISAYLRQHPLASVLAFLAARHLLRDKIRLLLNRRPKYRTLDKAVASDGWKVVVLMRLSPIVPFNLQNYALGVTAIPFVQYLTATLVGIVPGIALYVYFGIFGKGLGDGPSVFDWVLFGLGVLATVALAILVTRKVKTRLAQGESSELYGRHVSRAPPTLYDRTANGSPAARPGPKGRRGPPGSRRQTPREVENRQQRVETLRPPRPLRQDRRGEADLLLRAYVAPVADLAATNLDRPDAGLDCAMRPMAVTHDAVPTIR